MRTRRSVTAYRTWLLYHSVTLYRFRRHAPHELSARMSGGGLVLDDDLVTPSPVVHMWDRMHAPIHGSSDVSEV